MRLMDHPTYGWLTVIAVLTAASRAVSDHRLEWSMRRWIFISVISATFAQLFNQENEIY